MASACAFWAVPVCKCVCYFAKLFHTFVFCSYFWTFICLYWIWYLSKIKITLKKTSKSYIYIVLHLAPLLPTPFNIIDQIFVNILSVIPFMQVKQWNPSKFNAFHWPLDIFHQELWRILSQLNYTINQVLEASILPIIPLGNRGIRNKQAGGSHHHYVQSSTGSLKRSCSITWCG